MLGWSYYGERCAQFLLGPKVVMPFRVLWVIGCICRHANESWFSMEMSDALNGMMAIPNLLALLLLSPVVFKLTKQYFHQQATRPETKAN